MSLTLLSLWLTSSWQKQLAAARIAVGACAAQTLGLSTGLHLLFMPPPPRQGPGELVADSG